MSAWSSGVECGAGTFIRQGMERGLGSGKWAAHREGPLTGVVGRPCKNPYTPEYLIATARAKSAGAGQCLPGGTRTRPLRKCLPGAAVVPPCRRGRLPAKAREGAFGVSRPGLRRAPGVCRTTPCRRRSCISARVCRAGGTLPPPGELAGRRQQTRHSKPGIRHRSLRAVGGQRHFPQWDATSRTAICLLTPVNFLSRQYCRGCAGGCGAQFPAPRTHLPPRE